MPSAPIPPQVLAILAALIEQRTGIHYDARDADLLADKVRSRALDAGFESLLDYYYFLRYDDAAGREFAALVDAVVINESYFFREAEQLDVMISEFVAPRVAAGHRPRIWSAACAAGEEPLSIAMLLARRGLLHDVDIVATDISERALGRAATGEYGARAVRPPTDGASWYPWLAAAPNQRWRVSPELRDAIEWRRVNLVDEAETRALGTFDVIACRNVLIYFRDETVSTMVDRLAAALRPDGALFVGVSESLLRFGTALDCEERGGVFLYRKASPT